MPSIEPASRSTHSATPESSVAPRLAAIAALGGFVFGYAMAAISGAVTSIDALFIEPMNVGETARNTLSGFTVSSALFGCVVGALLAGGLSTRFGRKAGLMLAGPLFLVSALGSAWPELGFGRIGEVGSTALGAFYFYRLLGGLAAGIVSTLAPLYISEIAPPARRGHLVTYYQLAVVCGFVSVYLSNWLIGSSGDERWLHEVGWRFMLASVSLPAVLFLILLRTAPETPHGYLIRGRTDQAVTVLQQLSGENDVKERLDEIQRSLSAKRERLASFGMRVLLIGTSLAALQQLMGINVVLFYAPVMFQNMGASAGGALLQTALIAVVNMGFTFVAMYGVDSLGRRPLMIVGALIMATAMMSLGGLFVTGEPGIAAAIAASVYLGAFTFSWGPVTAVLLSEIFPTAIRSQALGIAMAVQWITNILVSWSFPILDGNSSLNAIFHHGFTYFLYGCLCLVGAVFVLRFVPETKGKSLEEIQGLWG